MRADLLPRPSAMFFQLSPLLARLRDDRGLAAFEFALAAPMLVSCVLGAVDINNAVITWERLSVAAEDIGEIATEMSAQPNGTNLLTSTQVWDAMTAAFAVLPNWKAQALANAPHYSITVSSIVYTPTVAGCTAGCTYTANTAWSVAFTPGIIQTRPCGVVTQVPNNQASALNELPVGLAGPSPLLVVDVAYTFQPLFAVFITGPIVMLQSAYLPPRIGTNAQYVVYSPSGTTATCPGY